MGGETAQAWRAVPGDLIKRGLRKPEFLIVDGGSGLDRALAELWSDVPTQRCTVHKHRNLLAHAPERRLLAAIRQASRLRDEVSADYNDMIYAAPAAEIEKKRKAFGRKWRLRCQAVADSLEEAGDRLFAFTKLPACQWKSARTTNAIERLHEEFKRRIKTRDRAAIGRNRRHDVSRPRPPPPAPRLRGGRLRGGMSGRWSPPDRSACGKSMAGKPSP